MLDRFDRHGSTDLVQPKQVDKIAIVRLEWMSPSRFPCQWCPSPGPEAASSVTQTSTGSRFCLCWSWLKTIQTTLCVCPQGLNFYTQVKTVTSMWREGDAGSSRSALSMPVLWNHFTEMYFCEEKILAIFVKNAITLASKTIQVSVIQTLYPDRWPHWK